jgi:hypothetical protein
MPYPAPLRVAFERGPQDCGRSEALLEEEDGKIDGGREAFIRGRVRDCDGCDTDCPIGMLDLEDVDIREDEEVDDETELVGEEVEA